MERSNDCPISWGFPGRARLHKRHLSIRTRLRLGPHPFNPNPEIRNRACACARARNRENSRSAATLAGTEELRKDRALFSARIANRSRMSTSRSTSTIPQTSEFRFSAPRLERNGSSTSLSNRLPTHRRAANGEPRTANSEPRTQPT